MYLITHCHQKDKKPDTARALCEVFTMGGYFDEPDALAGLASRITNELTSTNPNEDIVSDITKCLQEAMTYLQSMRINSKFSLITAFSVGGIRIDGSRNTDARLSITVRILKPNEDSPNGTRIENIIMLGWARFGDLDIL